MELTLTRDLCGAVCTLGKLSVDGAHECYTVEDVVRPNGEKVYGKTAIPAGRYQIVVTMSPRFRRRLPLLLNVPNFEGVRIHPGNTAADTEGCILPGVKRGRDAVYESRKAFDALFEKIDGALAVGDEVWLEIREA